MNEYPECFICKGTSISGSKPLGGRIDYPEQSEWLCFRCRTSKIVERTHDEIRMGNPG